MSETPETDALRESISAIHPWDAAFDDMTQHARDLERRLNAAKQEIQSWQKLAASSEILRKKAETQRDNAESDRKQADHIREAERLSRIPVVPT